MEAYHQREDKKKDMADNCAFWEKRFDMLNKLFHHFDELSKKVNEK